MNKNIKIFGAVIFMALIVLVFFSSTVYSFNIPVVTGVIPKNGKLQKKETSTGIADWADVEDIYTEAAGRVEAVFAEEGDIVVKGQEIAKLSFDTDDTLQKLKQLGIEKDKLLVSIESTNMKIDKLYRDIAELEEEVYEPDDVSDYDVVQLKAKIEKAEKSYTNIRIMYEVGGVTKQELDNSALELESLRMDYQNLMETKTQNYEKAMKNIDDKEKNRIKQIGDKKYEIETLQQDLKTKNLDIQKNEDDQAVLNKLLKSYDENMYIYAPADGTVISLSIKKGQSVNKNQLAASIGAGYTFTIQCSISLQNNFTVVGDQCKISNNDHSFVPTISNITPNANAKEVTIKIESDQITAGETFDIEFAKESAKQAVLVPNGAVNKDSDGYFVYRIKKRKGILGDEYYAEKLRIEVGDSDNNNTIVTKGITFFEPIILLSDKSFSEGDTISVKNEGDFFAN